MKERNEIVQALTLTPALLEGFMESIAASLLNRRRGAGYWTIKEHLAHLAEVQAMLLGRLRRFSEEARPRFTPHLPSDEEGETLPVERSVAELLEKFRAERSKQVALIKRFGDEVWTREAEHPEFSNYSTAILVRHILMHDHWHMYRMEELWITRDEYLTELH